MNNQQSSAAGIVVYQYQEQGKLYFLGLIALPSFQTKNNGLYDIPKGGIDHGETPIACAVREAKEEASIDITHLDSGPYVNDRLTVWLAESYQNPSIGINPATGLKEHLGYVWVSPEDMYDNCLDYLRPHIAWAINYLGAGADHAND
jgi:8-oxo-dGTP pyrophosphatase MutT (NUDIX family)